MTGNEDCSFSTTQLLLYFGLKRSNTVLGKSPSVSMEIGSKLTCTSTAECDKASFSANRTFETGTIPGSCPQVVIISLS